MPPDTVVQMLEGGLNRTLFDTHDQLNQQRRQQAVFYGYREPIPYPDFFPTYKRR